VLDRLLPQRTVTCRRRPSDPWFDQEHRDAKRRVRRLERASSRANRAATADPVSAKAAEAAAAAAAWTTERRAYRDLQLLRQKRETFWQTKVESERCTPRRLWQSIDSLMGRGHVPLSTSIDAPKLHRYFDEKIAGVCASTAHAAPPSYVAAPPHCEFSAFRVLINDDVIAAICKLPDKQCATDPLPTNLLKDNVGMLAPFVTELFNWSLSCGVFPSHFKAAFITPLLTSDMTSHLMGSHIDLYRT